MGIKTDLIALILLYLSVFMSFSAICVSRVSPELCKMESSNMVYIQRIRDCIVGLRLRLIALILSFCPYIACLH